jgi:uncharacterized protein YndB with AHSA1/START domain
MRRIIVALLSIVSLSAGLARADTVSVSKLALMTFDADGQINAPVAKVWASLTDADKAMSWCPLWKGATNPQPLTQVGNTMTFVDAWNNAGKSVVIFVDPGKELRVAHVPDNGSYVCQVKMVLTPVAGGTRIHVTEQYSDALDVPTDKDTAATTRKEIGAYVAALKAMSEKK